MTSARSEARPRSWLVAVLPASCVLTALAAWPQPRTAPAVVAMAPARTLVATHDAPRVAPLSSTRTRRNAPAPAPQPSPAASFEAEAEHSHRVEQSRVMVRLMRAQVRRSALGFADSPEAAANGARPYLEGWRDAVTALDPGLPDVMSDEVDAALCDRAALPAEQLSWLWLASEEPTFATTRGLECVVSARLEGSASEDVVLWAALEAWEAAGLAPSESLERLGRRTRETRTLRRLAAIRGEVRREAAIEHALHVRASAIGAAP